jgi:hypothetical protein
MASIAAALRAEIVACNIPNIMNQVYRDLAPPTTTYPYITYADHLNDRIALTGDKKVLARNYMVQVDLWEKRIEETESTLTTIVNCLENATLVDTDNKVFRCRLMDTQRIIQFDDDVVHHAISLNIYRKV